MRPATTRSRVANTGGDANSYAHRQTNQRTMGLWLAASFPALILVLSFIRFSFVFGRLILSGHNVTSRHRYMPHED